MVRQAQLITRMLSGSISEMLASVVRLMTISAFKFNSSKEAIDLIGTFHTHPNTSLKNSTIAQHLVCKNVSCCLLQSNQKNLNLGLHNPSKGILPIQVKGVYAKPMVLYFLQCSVHSQHTQIPSPYCFGLLLRSPTPRRVFSCELDSDAQVRREFSVEHVALGSANTLLPHVMDQPLSGSTWPWRMSAASLTLTWRYDTCHHLGLPSASSFPEADRSRRPSWSSVHASL
ncbi:hypothetical protein Fmac_018074 [Flemingia macrophylla]|uniref:Uncharacterized protein n=1 Tax=Flemingia macrophylla TaxID=520843 RepID=A0ABD1M3Z3_9FABA